MYIPKYLKFLFVFVSFVTLFAYGTFGLGISSLDYDSLKDFDLDLNLNFDKKEYSMIAVGDISYSRAVERAVKRREDLYYPFAETREFLSDADITFGNLETTVMEGRAINDNEMVFRSNPSTVQVLKDVGFDAVSLANNHTPDFREKGIVDTILNLEQVGIKHTGAGKDLNQALKPIIIELGKLKVAIVAFLDPAFVPDSYEVTSDSHGALIMNSQNLELAMLNARMSADLVFVSMHAGQEYVNKPNQFQIDFAREAIDLGAEMVIGHHPHVVQSMEKYKGKYIFYSLGNFIFDQHFSFDTRAGVALKFWFDKDGVNKVNLYPYFMRNFVQPKFVEGEEAEGIIDKLNYPLSVN